MDTENQKKNKTDIVNKYIYQWKKIKQNKTKLQVKVNHTGIC